MREKLFYNLKSCMALRRPTFTEFTVTQRSILDILCIKFVPNQMERIENAGKIILHPQVMYGFKETDFNRIYSYSAKYFVYFMYIICTKSNEKDRKCGKNYFTSSSKEWL